MSLVPLLFRDWWAGDFNMPLTSRILDQNFGTGLNRHDLTNSIWGDWPMRTYAGYMRPWHRAVDSLLKAENGSTVNIDKDKFEVILDVQQFSPKEINVKVTDDKYLVVEGKHEEKQDEHGYVARHFCRRYKLPDQVNPDQVKSALSSDGLLTLTAPLQALPPPGERAIPIQHTGKKGKKEEHMQVENK